MEILYETWKETEKVEKEAVTRLMPVITNSRTRFKVGYRACFSPLTSYLIRASFTIERTPLEPDNRDSINFKLSRSTCESNCQMAMFALEIFKG